MKKHLKKLALPFVALVGTPLLLSGCATGEQRPPESLNILNSSKAENNKVASSKKRNKPKPIIQTGRYSAVIAEPTESQRHLLQVMISIRVPNEIKTIKQTIQYLLKRSGYQLSEPDNQQKELAGLFKKKLPEVHRKIGPMTLEDALTVLAEPAFTLQQDSVHRLISYRLDRHYLVEHY